MLNPNIEYRSDRKFTTGTIGDFFRIRLNKKNLALANLLARMQMNATASFPSISQQQEVLSKFYDMSFEVVLQIMGPEIIMSYVTNFVEPVEVLDPEYTYKNIYKTFEKMAHHPLINEEKVASPTIEESPLSIECRVKTVTRLGSHDMFVAEVVNVRADDAYLDPATGRFMLEKADLLAYSHGFYHSLGQMIGKFGFSVKKN